MAANAGTRCLVLLLLLTVVCLTGLPVSTEPIDTKEYAAARPIPPQTLPNREVKKQHQDDTKPSPPSSASTEPHHSTHHPADSMEVPPVPQTATTTEERLRLPHFPSMKSTATASPETSSDATLEASARSLTPAAAMLLLIVIVTLVGLLHFKVCTELRRCWSAGGCGVDSLRSVRSNVMEKWKVALRGLSSRKGEVGDARSDTGQPLIHPSRMPTGGLSQASVDCPESSNV